MHVAYILYSCYDLHAYVSSHVLRVQAIAPVLFGAYEQAEATQAEKAAEEALALRFEIARRAIDDGPGGSQCSPDNICSKFGARQDFAEPEAVESSDISASARRCFYQYVFLP